LISNVTVEHADSRDIVRKYKDRFRFPIYYLDAHWIDDSAIDGELSLIKRGIVCIGDFDIEHPRFSYDNYTDGKLDAARIKKSVSMLSVYYTNNPDAIYELPCLQTGRRGGRAYLVLGEEQDYLQYCRYFARHELQPG
jgi:hypothetical protein